MQIANKQGGQGKTKQMGRSTVDKRTTNLCCHRCLRKNIALLYIIMLFLMEFSVQIAQVMYLELDRRNKKKEQDKLEFIEEHGEQAFAVVSKLSL